jgi:hypothetical protein
MDPQQIILDTVTRSEGKIDGLTDRVAVLDSRITALEIEVKGMVKRVDGINGCAKELSVEVEELTQSELFKAQAKRGRREILRLAGIIIGCLGVAASVTFSIIAVVCH